MSRTVVDPELLEILACPETKEPVEIATDELLERLNQAIAAGKVETRGGTKLSDPVEAGLVRRDGEILYPVRDGIPIMLVQDSIALAGI
jgi:uncharacterized protein YbaR (Trm112 family)